MIWKYVVGYEDFYKISEFGDILNVKTNKIRKTRPNTKHGYIDIDLYKNGKCRWKRVHRLVAEAFVPNPDNLPIVMHLDNNKQNNHYTNLKWGTISENTKQAFDDELIDKRKTYELYNDHENLKVIGLENLCEKTNYSNSSIAVYIKNNKPLLKGKYKGYKIKIS